MLPDVVADDGLVVMAEDGDLDAPALGCLVVWCLVVDGASVGFVLGATVGVDVSSHW